jgi:hypothetical protein
MVCETWKGKLTIDSFEWFILDSIKICESVTGNSMGNCSNRSHISCHIMDVVEVPCDLLS